ncbi:MAG: thiol-disulfide isomerase/thioredoxin [Myxococcota bacterium]|jgi:thiol-disulfide isomerase/thioredoxin
MLLWGVVAMAFGGDAALMAERARAELEAGHPDVARRLAVQAVREDPAVWSARRLYLKAAAAAGVRPLAEAEFVERSQTDPLDEVVWTWWRVSREQEELAVLEALAERRPDPGAVALAWSRWRLGDRSGALSDALPSDDALAQRLVLRATLRGDRPRDAARIGREWLTAHPERPDVLEEWWDGPDSRSVERARAWAVRQIGEALEASPDETYLYRVIRVLAAARAKEEAAFAAERLEAAGYARPLARSPWNPAMLHTMGRVLVRQRNPVAPPGTPTERFEMTSSLADALVDRGRVDEADGAWKALRVTDHSPRAALAHAVLLVEHDRADPALETAVAASLAVGTPQPTDVALLDTAGQALALAQAHGLQAELLLARGAVREALWASWVAHAVDPHPKWAALWARCLAANDGDSTAESGRATVDPVLVEASRTAPGADGELHGALVATLVNQARHAQVDSALGALAIAVMLKPLDPAVHAARAQRLSEAGHTEAAFMAHVLGGADAATIERHWVGLGSPPVDAARAAWRAAVMAHEGRLAALHPDAEAEAGSAAAASGATRERVKLGYPMPSWSVSVGPTVFDNSSTAGQALVLTMWASWCGPCKLEMPEIDSVVSELVADGLAVTGVAISMDENEKLFRRAKARDRYEALVVGWNPAVGRQLRVAALPTTWIVAPDGTVVDHQTGYDELYVSKLERLLRKHAPDQ